MKEITKRTGKENMMKSTKKRMKKEAEETKNNKNINQKKRQ